MSNENGKEIVVLDHGNSSISVIGFLDEFVNEKKVFDPEAYGHLPTYTNEMYHQEENERWEMIKEVLGNSLENFPEEFEPNPEPEKK